MSELIAAAFRGVDTARRALDAVLALEPGLVADLRDAVVVVRDGDGKLRLEQTRDPGSIGTPRGIAWGGLLGTLAGVVLLNPLAGLAAGIAVGAGAGALAGKLADYGIPDEFVRGASQELESNASALFIVLRNADTAGLERALEPFGPRLARTTLSAEQDESLRKALDGVRSPLR